MAIMSFPLCRQVVSSFASSSSSTGLSDDPNEYIFDFDVSLDSTRLCMSLSDCSISVVDREFSPVVGERLRGHTDRINALSFSPTDSNLIISASSDSTCCCWDTRTSNRPSNSISFPGEVSAMSLGVGGTLMAAASGTSLFFFDMRQTGMGPLGHYADCHTDDITSVKFHPEAGSPLLLSGGEDGLICLYDTSVSTNDEAVISILNTDCPTRRIGFFGKGFEGIYCLSSVEAATIWHYPSAQRISNFPFLRESLGCDYLVDCWYQNDGSLCLLAGDHSGKGVVTTLQPGDVHTIVGDMVDGHSSTIRCAYFDGDAIFTGGEDSRMCRWASCAVERSAIQPKKPVSSHSSLLSGESKSGAHRLKHSPYKT